MLREAHHAQDFIILGFSTEVFKKDNHGTKFIVKSKMFLKS